eukprot:CAMPEP_0171909498 /NCGR_PEP_ID=MMETSP0993-20121228/8797_1 /TAXON_ID=483369 /ORGANISM="non described non described, Strain CCMP2098" /LENGTH=47 /DNA_ID= /DNA_START= /DNA_END= /DNA_ORIENTATION=
MLAAWALPLALRGGALLCPQRTRRSRNSCARSETVRVTTSVAVATSN